MHNSDHMNKTIGNFSSMTELNEMAWFLRNEGHPSVVLTVAAIGEFEGREMLFITTGKTDYPNLHAFDMANGSEIWHASPSISDDPGPGACAMSSMALLDENGLLYISDCHYLFCYDVTATPDEQGTLRYKWRSPMQGLRTYNETDGLWYNATDPTLPQTRAKPFITLFFTRKVNGKSYLGGISTEGGVYIFDPDDGSLFAHTWLDSGMEADALDWTPDSAPCDVADYVAEDDPMIYDISPGSDDTLTPFGIWCTGVVPETNDPDADYFMDPCQLSGYFNANTVGGGGMVINTPAVARDPLRTSVSRIYVNGSQTPTLLATDITPAAVDAFVYRIDFDPTETVKKRLTLLNHEKERGNRYQYNGRMVNGENSLSSPTLSFNEKWIITGDNQGRLYNFSAEDGTLIWMEEIGALLGSPTVVQRTESDGLFYIHTFGDSSLWTFACDPESGAIMKQSRIDFRQYILRNYWRGDNPGYAEHFVNSSGHAYERAAVGASIAVATDDKMVLVYTVGWHDPDRPAPYLIPTHSVILTLHRLLLLSDTPSDAMIDSAYIDIHGTMEQATLIAPSREGLRFLIPHGSQSTTFARFLDVNDKMPESMRSLYMKPYGGVRLAEPIFAETPLLAPDLPSGQMVGTPIRWKAYYPDNLSLDYRFSVSIIPETASLSKNIQVPLSQNGQMPSKTTASMASKEISGETFKTMHILKDFSPSPVAVWTPMQTGIHTVEVTFRDRESKVELGSHSVSFQVTSPIHSEDLAAIISSSHPLVPIVSCSSCPPGARMRVDYHDIDVEDTNDWQSTGYVACSYDGSAHLYVAGLKSGVTYALRPVVVQKGVERLPLSDSTLKYTPDSVGITFPDITPLMSVDDNADRYVMEKYLFMAGFPESPSNPLPLVTDLAGTTVWYYPGFKEESVVATSPTPEGTLLLITADDKIQGQRLQEVDLAGQVVREVTINRINEQLAEIGQDSAGAFDHEAVRFPDGNTLVQLTVERELAGIQEASDVILGSIIVALDRNWQVKWAWNSFDHMDVNRSAIMGEVCRHSDSFTFPGCPPLFEASRANDWIHGNHIAPSPVDNNLIYSMRNQDWVIKIDYAGGTGSGSVIWRLGANGDLSLDGTSPDSNSDKWFSHQHGATYVSENQLLIFDNGNTRCTNVDDPDRCNSRGQLYTLNEGDKSATLSLNADLGVYSMALGNAQRLANGTFNFTPGLLTEEKSPTGQVMEVGSAGEKISLFQADMNIYRSYRMQNLYAASWDGFSRCAARLFSNFTLKIPIIDIGGGQFIDVDLAWDPLFDDFRFLMTNFSEIEYLPDYTACETAFMQWDGVQYLVTLPNLAFGLDGYLVTMSLLLGKEGDIWFKLNDIKALP
ncbi:aryl-sulfate sulfotransferase [Desulfamplus magnetovallimortis]|nr:aryl-sulfate sulfotransferase [Desulfamplus magnetovallimortis]